MASQIISHPRAGFGLHDIFGTLLKARLEHLLDHFIRPHSIRLPFDVSVLNFSAVKFLLCFAAKRIGLDLPHQMYQVYPMARCV